jgi:N-acetylmuramoyl-L-alanine amidase
VAGQLSDITFGACHYHAVSVLPKWAVGKVPCLSLGQHRFYNNVL